MRRTFVPTDDKAEMMNRAERNRTSSNGVSGNGADDNGSDGLGRLFYEAFGVFRDRFSTKLDRAGHPGVGLTHTRILHHAGDEGGTLSAVAERTGISRQAVAKAAREMERLGYIRIEVSADDSRAKRVHVTDQGRTLTGVIDSTIREIETELAAAVGCDELEHMRTTVRLLCETELPPA